MLADRRQENQVEEGIQASWDRDLRLECVKCRKQPSPLFEVTVRYHVRRAHQAQR